MRRDLEDERSNREILLCIERRFNLLQGIALMDLYDRIIAGVAAIQSGDGGQLQQHVAAIDNHLSQIDDENLKLEGDDNSNKSRLDAIEAGLAKIADGIAPAPAPSTSVSTSVSTSDSVSSAVSTSDSAPSSDSVSSAVSTSDSVAL